MGRLERLGCFALGFAIWAVVGVADFFVYELAWNTSLTQLKANPFQILIVTTLMVFSLIWTILGAIAGGFFLWCGFDE